MTKVSRFITRLDGAFRGTLMDLRMNSLKLTGLHGVRVNRTDARFFAPVLLFEQQKLIKLHLLYFTARKFYVFKKSQQNEKPSSRRPKKSKSLTSANLRCLQPAQIFFLVVFCTKRAVSFKRGTESIR